MNGLEDGVPDALSATAILGVTMSCLNGAWNSRFIIRNKPTRMAATLITSITLCKYIKEYSIAETSGSLYFLLRAIISFI